MTILDKRERSQIFRARLLQQVAATGISRSELARATGVDRSTIAQLLGDSEARLPNAQLAAECAQALSVSTDWLLGLTDRPERPGDVIAAAISMPRAARSSADDQLLEWHREAAGYKIRHVPATLPDVLKSEDLLKWEYRRFLGKSPNQAIGAMRDWYAWMREQLSDYEIAVSAGELKAFAAGAGYYDGLAAKIRRQQLDAMIAALEDNYPSLRMFVYDGRRVFSAPITVFGPLLGVIYVGRFYLAFRSKERVRSLAEHFDGLVREATVDARDAAKWLKGLAASVKGR